MDIRKEKMISIALIMEKDNYIINETINRRINKYDFQEHTSITHDDKQIKISTETNIKGVYNVLIIYPDGMSKLDFEFK
ncbi:MAG: hypothetical protein IKB93_14880 [Clostridia bacterium]|nr:hypothetical protein [Clostridia bacterium]